MTTVEQPTTDDLVDGMDVPSAVSCFKLNADGSYEPSTHVWCSVYIDDLQIDKIWNPKVSGFIRENYGPYVGVMHRKRRDVQAPIYPTYKYVLGG